MRHYRIAVMIDLQEDLLELIADHILEKFTTLEQFSNTVYTYQGDDDYQIGDLVVVPMRHLKVVGRIEEIDTDPNDEIEYKEIIRRVMRNEKGNTSNSRALKYSTFDSVRK